MKNILLILLGITLLNAIHLDNHQQQYYYDDYGYEKQTSNQLVFALTWLDGFCHNSYKCDEKFLKRWDHQSFTIHGLWPQANTDEDYGALDAKMLKQHKGLWDDLMNYFPPRSDSKQVEQSQKYWLWRHEWSNYPSDYYGNGHGQDYADYLKTHFSSYKSLSKKDLQRKFFEDVVKAYEQLKIQKIPQARYSKDQLANHLKLKQNQFSVLCSDYYHVKELRVCYRFKKSISLNELPIEVATCPDYTLQSSQNCGDDFYLGGWAKSSQNTVIAKVDGA